MEFSTYQRVIDFVKAWPHEWVKSKTVARKLGMKHKEVKWVLRNAKTHVQMEMRSPVSSNKRCIWKPKA